MAVIELIKKTSDCLLCVMRRRLLSKMLIIFVAMYKELGYLCMLLFCYCFEVVDVRRGLSMVEK